MKKIILAVLLVAGGAQAQVYTANRPVTCNPNVPGDCVKATTVVNPDGTNVGSGGGSVPSAAAGASSTTAVPVQRPDGTAIASDATVNSLFKSGQSIGNAGFNALQGGAANAAGNPFYNQLVAGTAIFGGITNTSFGSSGSAGTLFQQGTGAAGANALNVYLGGQFAAVSVTGTVTTAAGSQTTLQAGTANVGSTTGSLGYDDTTTALAASASFFGTVRATPAGGWAMSFHCRATPTGGAGTLYVAETVGGASLNLVGNAAPAGVATELVVSVLGTASSYQCQYANGTTATTAFRLNSAFQAK